MMRSLFAQAVEKVIMLPEDLMDHAPAQIILAIFILSLVLGYYRRNPDQTIGSMTCSCILSSWYIIARVLVYEWLQGAFTMEAIGARLLPEDLTLAPFQIGVGLVTSGLVLLFNWDEDKSLDMGDALVLIYSAWIFGRYIIFMTILQ